MNPETTSRTSLLIGAFSGWVWLATIVATIALILWAIFGEGK